MKPIMPMVLIFALSAGAQAQRIVVGSKRFTESYVLGEIAKTTLQNAGFAAEVRPGMGGTIILWQALQGGEITLYPEYTGTIAEEILKTKPPLGTDQMSALLRLRGVGMTGELGFNNTYALVMQRDRAAKLGLHQISDLRDHPDLNIGLTHEFLDRQDGWMPLSARYGLQMRNVRGWRDKIKILVVQFFPARIHFRQGGVVRWQICGVMCEDNALGFHLEMAVLR